MKNVQHVVTMLGATLALGISSFAQVQVKPATVADTAKAAVKPPVTAIKSYKDIITAKAKTSTGFLKVHKVDDRYFFEIPDSVLNRDVLLVNRIAQGAADVKPQGIGYAGDEIGESVVQFEKGPNNKVFIRSKSFLERSKDTSDNGLYRSVLNNNIQPIVAAFDIKAFAPDSLGVVIDITDFINGDNDVFFFEAAAKKVLGLTAIQADKSYIAGVQAFPINVEIKTVKTYMKGSAIPGSAASPATFGLNSSVVLLPRTPMRARLFDSRVGYFATGFVDYDANPQGVKQLFNVWRWRLEPKPEDMEKYKKGELVEPQKPIVIYIDPATPKKWVPYLIAGINDWQAAFEKAGFKNAIVGKEAPVGDSTWSIDDARHSVVVYKPSAIANAMGPSVKDPRSGEILETHIHWYHNVMDLLYKWYFIQAAAIDPRAQKPSFDDSLMGQLIRFVSSHEVGHTLGLRHNWGASSTVPVDSLRSKKWLTKNGHTPSIMDYARFNYVAQPEDEIGVNNIYPHIGDYDKWAIEWGYKWLPDNVTATAENDILNKWIVNKLASGKQYFFGSETSTIDPRCQSEDLGDDAVKASNYGIKNLKRIMPNLLKWTAVPTEGYDQAGAMYTELGNQYIRYMMHVVKSVGGLIITPKSIEQPGPQLEPVAKAKQQEAMRFFNEQLFTTPKWFMSDKMYGLTGVTGYSFAVRGQTVVLNSLLSNDRFNRMLQQQSIYPDTYTLTEMLQDLTKSIFSELPAHAPIDMYRRNLQRMYVEGITIFITAEAGAKMSVGAVTLTGASPAANSINDAVPVIKSNIRALLAMVKDALTGTSDTMTKAHLQDLKERLTAALKSKSGNAAE